MTTPGSPPTPALSNKIVSPSWTDLDCDGWGIEEEGVDRSDGTCTFRREEQRCKENLEDTSALAMQDHQVVHACNQQKPGPQISGWTSPPLAFTISG